MELKHLHVSDLSEEEMCQTVAYLGWLDYKFRYNRILA
jgi:hypothetical protein